jgi:hypothetical protein
MMSAFFEHDPKNGSPLLRQALTHKKTLTAKGTSSEHAHMSEFAAFHQ